MITDVDAKSSILAGSSKHTPEITCYISKILGSSPDCDRARLPEQGACLSGTDIGLVEDGSMKIRVLPWAN